MEKEDSNMSDQKKQNLADPKIRKRFVTYKEAAELWREDEARRMQRAIKIVFNKERVEIDGSTTKEIIITRAFRHNSNIPRIPKNN